MRRITKNSKDLFELQDGNGNILLIEDDLCLSQAYAYYLRSMGYDIETATNAVEAREKLSKQKPNLILLDLIMPGMNGFEFLAEIKNIAELKDIPVIIISNLCQEGDIEKCDELGAVEYFIKSNFFMRDIVEKIRLYI